MEKHNPLKRLWSLVATERAEIRNIYVFAIFQGLVNLSLPLGIQAIINLLQTGQLRASWVVLVSFVLLGILFYGILQLKQMTITEAIEQRLFVKSAFDFSYRIPRLSVDAIRGRYVPELMNRFFEVMTVQKGITKLLIDFSAAAVQILFGLALLSFYHPLFILLGIVLVFLLYLIFRLTGAAGMQSSLEESSYKFAVAHWLEEVSRNLMTFKLSGDSDLPLQRADELSTGYLKARQRHFKILVTQYKVLILFKVVLAASLIIAGSVLVVNGQINIGQFVAAEIIILLVINSVEKIILNMSTVYDVLTALEKIGSISDLELERESGTDIAPDKSAMHLQVKELRFRYKDADEDTISNLSFEVLPGQSICICGENGTGKTTLLKLLAGIYPNYEGSILYDTTPLVNWYLPALRARMGENLSEQEIFKGSIAENILCGKPGLDLKDVIRAARIVHLDKHIEKLPGGYETLLDPEGKRLSTGIVRKIILARCLVSNPGVLLIEDNLSSLTPDEKNSFFDFVFDTKQSITTVIVSNDPTVIRRCQNVLELKSGKN